MKKTSIFILANLIAFTGFAQKSQQPKEGGRHARAPQRQEVQATVQQLSPAQVAFVVSSLKKTKDLYQLEQILSGKNAQATKSKKGKKSTDARKSQENAKKAGKKDSKKPELKKANKKDSKKSADKRNHSKRPQMQKAPQQRGQRPEMRGQGSQMRGQGSQMRGQSQPVHQYPMQMGHGRHMRR